MTFVANPHALLTNDIVTDVVYMQDYDAEQIKETLSNYVYEEVINCSEYGKELYVGWFRVGEDIVRPRPNPNWEFDHQLKDWAPNAEHQKLLEEGSSNGFTDELVTKLTNLGQYSVSPSKVRPFASWIFNNASELWEPPVSHPNDGLSYMWDERNLSWVMCAACNQELAVFSAKTPEKTSTEKRY